MVGLDELQHLFQPNVHIQEEVEEETAMNMMCSLRGNSQTKKKQQDEN